MLDGLRQFIADIVAPQAQDRVGEELDVLPINAQSLDDLDRQSRNRGSACREMIRRTSERLSVPILNVESGSLRPRFAIILDNTTGPLK